VAPPVSSLLPEARLLREARDALVRGDVGTAEANLARARGLGHASLAEERDALAVRCADARGDRARARRLGEAFLATYPSSPSALQISKIVRAAKKD